MDGHENCCDEILACLNAEGIRIGQDDEMPQAGFSEAVNWAGGGAIGTLIGAGIGSLIPLPGAGWVGATIGSAAGGFISGFISENKEAINEVIEKANQIRWELDQAKSEYYMGIGEDLGRRISDLLGRPEGYYNLNATWSEEEEQAEREARARAALEQIQRDEALNYWMYGDENYSQAEFLGYLSQEGRGDLDSLRADLDSVRAEANSATTTATEATATAAGANTTANQANNAIGGIVLTLASLAASVAQAIQTANNAAAAAAANTYRPSEANSRGPMPVPPV